MNVALNATKVSQKWSFPSPSSYIFPVIFGNQW